MSQPAQTTVQAAEVAPTLVGPPTEANGIVVQTDDPDDWIARVPRCMGAQRITAEGGDFRGSFRYWNLGRVRLADIRGTTCTLTRLSSHVQGSAVSGHYWLSALVAGEVKETGAHGDVVSFHPGDVAVTTMLDADMNLSTSRFHWISLLVPQSLLSLPAQTIGDGASLRLERGSGLVEPFHAVIESLSRSISTLSKPEATRALMSVAELAEVMVSVGFGSGARKGAADRLSRLQALKDYIRLNLRDPDLDVAAIARAHHVSIRYVHGLFAENGERAATWIRQRRIEHACRDLLDPRLDRLPIGAIATRNGFTTASHFGQLFRDAVGVTPAVYRNTANNAVPQHSNAFVS
ncbi:AraC family transcriptional regulator [Streptomyces sp. NPDC007162]|uniref:AraC family transcriptional regulator n=1 Tax=Streptomyces sp. NPDC007162 TaxID=3156917 RepID=UPI0033FB91B2